MAVLDVSPWHEAIPGSHQAALDPTGEAWTGSVPPSQRPVPQEPPTRWGAPPFPLPWAGLQARQAADPAGQGVALVCVS